MGSRMEGPMKSTLGQRLNLEMHGRAQGSSALAQLIAGGNFRPDVFIPITPGPMLTVLRAGKGETAEPIAHTEMVIAYNPKAVLRRNSKQPPTVKETGGKSCRNLACVSVALIQ